MIKFLIQAINIKWAIYKANTMHNLTWPHQQYYVLKFHGKIIVRSSQQIRNMKKKGLLTKDFDWKKLQEVAIYKTKLNDKAKQML